MTAVPGASSEGDRLREALDRLPAATCYRTHTQPDEGKGVFGAVWKADVLRVAPPSEPGLDAAWAEAEAALPEDHGMWLIQGVQLVDTYDGPIEDIEMEQLEWEAEAVDHERYSQARSVTGLGPTPAAALRALAARLGEGQSRG